MKDEGDFDNSETKEFLSVIGFCLQVGCWRIFFCRKCRRQSAKEGPVINKNTSNGHNSEAKAAHIMYENTFVCVWCQVPQQWLYYNGATLT